MKKIIFLLAAFFLVSSAFALDQSFRHRVSSLGSAYDVNDVVAEIEFGKNLAARILTKYPLAKNRSLQNYVSTMGAGMAAHVGRPELKYHFAVIEANDVNAYACPGGYIFITKGAMKLIKDEAQLAGVLAHEIAHVNERHVIKKLKIKGHDSSFASGLASLVGGATASYRMALSTLLDEGYALLFEKGIEKEEEHQADALAVETLYSLGYDLKSYYDLIKSLYPEEKAGRAPVVSQTHPKVRARLIRIRNFIKENRITGKDSIVTNVNRYNEYVKL